jgi:KDO2-lipid IV(A) lauroyltransferase
MFRTYMVDAFQLPRVVTEESWQRHVDLTNARPGTKLMIGEHAAIYLGPHAGNWELLGFFPTLMGFRMHALARPLDNPFIWQWAVGLRENRGMKIITKFGATEELQNIIHNGGRIAFIADQNAGPDGIFVPYFGQMASAYKSIALLAIRYELPVAVGVALRDGDGFNFSIHTVDIIQPDDWRDHEDPVFYITARYTNAMERGIMLAPDQYLWIHRRWRSRPKWEREGKPLPERIKTKLRTLPWMNEAMIERISADTDRRVREQSSGAA